MNDKIFNMKKVECSFCTTEKCDDCNNNLRTIRSNLIDRLNYIRERYPDLWILYVALHGSQNYRMAGPNSDIDCYMIVLPKAEDIFIGKEISKTINYIDGSHISLKDLNTFIKEIKKGSFNIMEFIDPYIKPYFLDEKFLELINYLKGKELIINPIRMYASISGVAKKLTLSTDPKNLSRLQWACYFGENLFLNHLPYKQAISLTDEQVKRVRYIKFGNLSESELLDIKTELTDRFNYLYNFEHGMINPPETPAETLSQILSELDRYVAAIYWDHIIRELNKKHSLK